MAPQPQPAARATRADLEAWQKAITTDGGVELGRIATTLARANTSGQLHALILVLRDELDETRKHALRRQLELARKRHWLFEHRLQVALDTLAADDDERARQVLEGDGIPLERVTQTAAELRQARAARHDGEAA